MHALKSAPPRLKRVAPGSRHTITRKSWWRRIQRLAINTFLIIHLLAIICWAVPFSDPLAGAFRNLIRPYFLWAGLFQSWDMFSPNPKSANSYVDAIVLYEDGNTRNWAFPRMELLNWKERYSKERYRKFVENVKDDANAPLWPDVARFIARVNNQRPAPVKMVFLVRHWSDIVVREDGSFGRAPWDAHVFYACKISPGDLQ
jgi:hypothetical protein